MNNDLRWPAARATILAVALACSACTSYRLEYDRMTGTAFPPSQTVAGSSVTLTSIYAKVGYLLPVVEDETGIAPLTGPVDPTDPNQYDYITEAELDALEAAHRSSPVGDSSWACGFWVFNGTCRRYHVYGIVVNHYYEDDDGTRDTGVMGLMWTGDNRRAFANFYKNATVSGNGGKYLRSAAHEIGHAFNLHHEDGDGSTTIMNQTWVVDDNYVYEFSAASKTHLKDHPANCVRPGMGAFGSVAAAHTDHGWTTADCS